MVPFRITACRCIASLCFLFILSACGTARASNATPKVLPTGIPAASQQTNTFPPIKYNGATLRFLHYGLEEGLSQSSALTILQDKQGFLWVGTQDGLNRLNITSAAAKHARNGLAHFGPFSLVGDLVQAIQ